ncbi:MAG: hypothetical protein AAB883_02620 [Patescibacteria group bacterium]
MLKEESTNCLLCALTDTTADEYETTSLLKPYYPMDAPGEVQFVRRCWLRGHEQTTPSFDDVEDMVVVIIFDMYQPIEEMVEDVFTALFHGARDVDVVTSRVHFTQDDRDTFEGMPIRRVLGLGVNIDAASKMPKMIPMI